MERKQTNILFVLILFLTGDAMEYIRSAHSVYLLTYHIVFVTKYRKPVINDEISEFLKTISDTSAPGSMRSC